MSIVTVPDGALVTQDPSDQVFYQFDWDTDNLGTGVEIDTSTFKITPLNVAAEALFQTVTSWVYDGALTAIVTFPTPHGYVAFDDITFSGANESDINRTWTVDSVTSLTVSLGFGAPAAFTATGTITAAIGIDEVSILAGNRYTQFRFRNSTLGAKYRISNRIVTNESATQTKERSIDVLIEDR
jgi:hypothetical protein